MLMMHLGVFIRLWAGQLTSIFIHDLFFFVLAAAVSVGLKQGKTVIVVKVSNGAKIAILSYIFFAMYS